MTGEKYVLHCGDCLDILPKIGDNAVDAVITDFPPYCLHNKIRRGTASGFCSQIQV